MQLDRSNYTWSGCYSSNDPNTCLLQKQNKEKKILKNKTNHDKFEEQQKLDVNGYLKQKTTKKQKNKLSKICQCKTASWWFQASKTDVYTDLF